MAKVKSDGSTASYYELPALAKELQHLISFKNMNGQIAEIFRACYRYGEVEHSERLRDAKKILFYAKAEVERLELYGDVDAPVVDDEEEEWAEEELNRKANWLRDQPLDQLRKDIEDMQGGADTIGKLRDQIAEWADSQEKENHAAIMGMVDTVDNTPNRKVFRKADPKRPMPHYTFEEKNDGC